MTKWRLSKGFEGKDMMFSDNGAFEGEAKISTINSMCLKIAIALRTCFPLIALES